MAPSTPSRVKTMSRLSIRVARRCGILDAAISIASRNKDLTPLAATLLSLFLSHLLSFLDSYHLLLIGS